MSLLESALEAEARGSSVIPVFIKSKHPATLWKPYQTRRATPEQIRAWWGRTPDLNLGLVTGRISG